MNGLNSNAATPQRQRVTVFQQDGSGERKIAGVRRYGADIIDLEIVSIDVALPLVIDDSNAYLPRRLETDLVLDYLKHYDLSHDLAQRCAKQRIPIVVTGKKSLNSWSLIPPTCCGLPRNDRLGHYGERFGAPEFTVTIDAGLVTDICVVRGAPCGATWEAVVGLIGETPEEAVRKIGLFTQFSCSADPAGWDPIYGKSPVHFAGKVHSKALSRAVDLFLSSR